MTEKKDPRPIYDADQGPERIDPRSGLDRLKKAMQTILKVPKSAVANRDDQGRTSELE